MFTRVLIFATTVVAVSAQDHYSHGHGSSSHSIVHHDKSHSNHEQESSYHPSSSVTHSDSNSHYRPTYYVAPVAHTAAVTRAVPVSHIAPIAYTHHRTPVHKARVIHVPVAQHYSPIFTHHTHVHPVAPILHQATPHYAMPAIALQHIAAHYNQQQYTQEPQDYHTHPKYEYEYNVHDSHTGDIKSQHEARDGDEVNGAYSVHEADGSVRTVNYNTHGHSGFNAEVHHSQPSTHSQPSHYYHH